MMKVTTKFSTGADLTRIAEERISKTIRKFFTEAHALSLAATPRDTGEAAKSLDVRIEKLGGSLKYAKHYVKFPQYGTVYQAPQAWFWECIAEAKQKHSLKQVRIDD